MQLMRTEFIIDLAIIVHSFKIEVKILFLTRTKTDKSRKTNFTLNEMIKKTGCSKWNLSSAEEKLRDNFFIFQVI